MALSISFSPGNSTGWMKAAPVTLLGGVSCGLYRRSLFQPHLETYPRRTRPHPPILMGLFLHDNHSGKKMQRVIQKNLIPFPCPVPSALSPPVPSAPWPKGPVANIHAVCYDSYRACERRLRVRFTCPGKVSVEDVNRIGSPFRRLWTRSARRSRRGSSDR